MARKSKLRKMCAVWIVGAMLASMAVGAVQTGKVKPPVLYFCGQPGSPVQIEVFSDFQCPKCRVFYFGVIKPLMKDYTASKKVYVVYHDFPLEMHPFARTAARLSLAAMSLGRDRWLRVTDALYANQDQWAIDGKFDPILAKVLVPTEAIRVKNIATNPAIEAELQQELMLGESRKITGTPTCFIITSPGRQQRLENGELPYSVLKDFIENHLKTK